MSLSTDSTNTMNIDLYQLVYVSYITSTGLLNAGTLNDIAEVSIANNEADNITGILCYGNGCFLQCVEGTEQALTNLKNRLLLDDRHKNLKILEFVKIAKRVFTGWSLRSITLERWMINDPKIKSLLPFKPYEWKSNQHRQFLTVLQEYYENHEKAETIDIQPIKYNALGLTLGKVVGQHQAFLLIQAVLGLLIILALVSFVLSDKF